MPDILELDFTKSGYFKDGDSGNDYNKMVLNSMLGHSTIELNHRSKVGETGMIINDILDSLDMPRIAVGFIMGFDHVPDNGLFTWSEDYKTIYISLKEAVNIPKMMNEEIWEDLKR